jgi:hypothetical protein
MLSDPTAITARPVEDPGRFVFPGLFLVGFSTLLLEVALTRVLSFTIWYHFAYVIISAALLGYGAAGSVWAVRPRVSAVQARAALARSSAGAGVTALGAILLFALARLDPMKVFADPWQLALFIAYQVAAAVPFFASGLAVCLALRVSADRVERAYAWDLAGAALGAAAAVVLMDRLSPPGAAILGCGGFVLAAAIFAPTGRARYAAIATGAVLAFGAAYAQHLPFQPAPSKHLIPELQFWETVSSRWTALFRTDLLADRGLGPPITNRHEWGLSGHAPQNIQRPPLAINHDGSAGTAVYDLRQGGLEFLDLDVLRFPYLVVAPGPRVLVIGVGGGRDVVAALRFGASHVTGVDVDAATVDLLRHDLNDVLSGLFHRPDVAVVASEGRHFVRTTSATFDVIQLTGVDTLAATFSGAYVLAENYLYTVEALDDLLGRLRPGGVLSFGTGEFDPHHPKASGRLVSVARAALLARGIARPENHIAVIDSRRGLVEIMIREAGFSEADVKTLGDRAEALGFVPRLLPRGVGTAPYPALAAAAGDERRRILAGEPFELSATTDDRPFFFAFYRWRDLFDAEVLTPAHTAKMGQLVLIVLLATLTALGGACILGPLAIMRRGRAVSARVALPVLVYFLGVGLGFMLFEITLIQRFVLFLGHPTYSLGVTLAALLVALGMGSRWSHRWRGRERAALVGALGTLLALTFLYRATLAPIHQAALHWPLAPRVALSVLLLLPLGFVLGHFFPLGLRLAEAQHEPLIPWAWAINGCASVTGTVLAVVLAMTVGFELVWMLSVAVYAAGVGALFALPGRAAARGVDGHSIA